MTTETKLQRIAQLSKKDPQRNFINLMCMFNEEAFRECFDGLNKKKAVGVDKVTKEMYGLNLDQNLEDLVIRMKKMAYRPGPVKQVQIPKEGKPGSTRPIQISNFEDKIVEKMMQRVLESIYEPIFLNSSYGFRVGRGCHDAIRDLEQYLHYNQIQVVIDVDIENFFGTIDLKLLEGILREKIHDKTLMRYIIRMFKAGVLSKGELQISSEGIAQGSICSPVLANIFAHRVIDEWVEEMVKPNCVGKAELFRYGDDMIICCQYRKDAMRINKALHRRLAKFNLRLNKEKTKIVPFSKREAGRGKSQKSFDFLGFTFYLGRSKGGNIIPKVKTSGKKFRAKLKNVNAWSKAIRNKMKLADIWKLFQAKIRGHIQYYGVSHNTVRVNEFINQSKRILFKWLNRRSQKKSFDWDKFNKFISRYPLPEPRVVHNLF